MVFASEVDLLNAPARPGLARLNGLSDVIENWLSNERDQLPLWIPVGLGLGIVFWQWFGDGALTFVAITAALIFLTARALRHSSRLAAILKLGAVSILIGFLAIYLKSNLVAEKPLSNMQITEFFGRITKVEHLAARNKVRFELETGRHAGLPSKIRVNLTPEQDRAEFSEGAIIRLRARLVPPASSVLPGAYDFARRAWFSGIGATGSALGEVKLYKAAPNAAFLSSLRRNLAQHVTEKLPNNSGTIAVALITGEQGQINSDDAEAMRNSGMAHLLSISGLHVTAVVGTLFLIISRFLALFPRIALRVPIPVVAAGFAALGAIGYTLLTGSQVPTVRSCVAALMVLTALAMGRDALSLRLVGFGATIVMLFWPEALAGPSFQLSFAAVATIILLHDSKYMRAFAALQQGGRVFRMFRSIAMLLATGLAIELVLAPITLFHFHKTGLYGALANVIAIPLTTFIVMPFEALALIFDIFGAGAPFWWVTGQGLNFILTLARYVSNLPGSVTMLPSMPIWAFGCIVMGGLWAGLLKTKMRRLGLIPLFAGLAAMLTAPYPDLLVTGDGKHLALVDKSGRLVLLRPRAGPYVQDTLKEVAGINIEPIAIDEYPGAQCSPDSCTISMYRGGRNWIILAIRTRYTIPAMELAAACRRVDIVVSDRWLPRSCNPQWLKADRNLLSRTGGLSFQLAQAQIQSVADQNPNAPWVIANNQAAQERKYSSQRR